MKTLYANLFQFCIIKALIIVAVAAIFCFFIRILYQAYKQRLGGMTTKYILIEALYKPAIVLISIMGVTYALGAICSHWKGINDNQLHLIRNLALVTLFAWFLWRFVTLYSAAFLKQLPEKQTNNKILDKTLVHGLSQIAKLAILLLAILSILQIMGFSIAGVLAFGGMGGIIVGLAAKDWLANLFGSLMLFLDRPFVVGDQINLPALQVEGVVEEIGWRVCQIRNSKCRPVTIPNALFSNLVVENASRMKYRQFYCQFSLCYQDLMKVPAILAEMKTLLKKNTDIDQTRPITVNLNELTNTSLNIVVTAYTNIVDSVDFLALQQALFLDLLVCIQKHGAKWSFPSYSVYLNNAGQIDTITSMQNDNK